MINKFILFSAILLMLASCSDNAASSDKKITIADSIPSLTGDQLARCLPPAIGPLIKDSGTMESAHIGTSGTKYQSFARQQYVAGQSVYFVEIIDYKNDEQTLDGLIHMYGFDSVISNAEFESKPVQLSIPHTKGITTVYSHELQAKLNIAYQHRFMINAGVIGNKDTGVLNKLAVHINYALLDSLARQPGPEKPDDKKVAGLSAQP